MQPYCEQIRLHLIPISDAGTNELVLYQQNGIVSMRSLNILCSIMSFECTQRYSVHQRSFNILKNLEFVLQSTMYILGTHVLRYLDVQGFSVCCGPMTDCWIQGLGRQVVFGLNQFERKKSQISITHCMQTFSNCSIRDCLH